MPSQFQRYWKRIDQCPGTLESATSDQLREVKEMVKEAFHHIPHPTKKYIEKLEAQMRELERLLTIAQCPANCVSGTIEKGAYQHPDGEIEYDLEQCQFCDEREQALNPSGKKEDE